MNRFHLLNLLIILTISLGLNFSYAKNNGKVERATSSTKKEKAPERRIVIPDNQEELRARCANESETLSPDYFIPHKAYSISYNFKHKMPNWVYHRLNRENLKNSCAKRSDKFKTDPYLIKNQLPAVTDKDYSGTGFDRGHLAPSADFQWSTEINRESFFMSNMAPQTANLNQKAWNNLEDRVRLWACGHGELRIYTGPVLREDLKMLNSCISVPEQFFKVILSYKDGKYSGIAFIYNQTDSGDPYRERATSIREVEKLTGIDFFKDEFAQSVQNRFEKEFNWADWDGTEVDCKACPNNPEN